jgi:hypothetical protein
LLLLGSLGDSIARRGFAGVARVAPHFPPELLQLQLQDFQPCRQHGILRSQFPVLRNKFLVLRKEAPYFFGKAHPTCLAVLARSVVDHRALRALTL